MPGRLILACALIGLLAACEDPTEPIFDQQPRILVHAVLDPAADTQKVILDWTVVNSSNPSFSSATVRMTAPDGRVQTLLLRQPANAPPPSDSRQTRFIMVLSQTWGSLQRNGTYKLDITMPGRPEISGTTTIPDTTPTNTVLVHTLPFLRDVDTLKLKWPRVRGAAAYRVFSVGTIRVQGQDFPSALATMFADTSVVLPGDKESFDGIEFFPPDYTMDVTVAAVDDNYATYYRAGQDPFAGAPPTRLSGGAIGVFGSIVPIHRRRFVVQ